jgi:hypothetical protein
VGVPEWTGVEQGHLLEDSPLTARELSLIFFRVGDDVFRSCLPESRGQTWRVNSLREYPPTGINC